MKQISRIKLKSCFVMLTYFCSFFVAKTKQQQQPSDGIPVSPPAAANDFTLKCSPGYRVTSIRRNNSPHQRGRIGSLSIECQIIQANHLDQIKCETRESAPACNGVAHEGCGDSEWLAGFQVIIVDNQTNAQILDPICCESPSVQVDATSCASERMNAPKMPFEHEILAPDLVYRGLQCWQQYDSKYSVVDIVWKIEVCQFSAVRTDAVGAGKSFVGDRRRPQQVFNLFSGKHTNLAIPAIPTAANKRNGSISATAFGEFSSPALLEHCPTCRCNCGIDLCGNGAEPIKIVHKVFHAAKCSCDCICRYECIF